MPPTPPRPEKKNEEEEEQEGVVEEEEGEVEQEVEVAEEEESGGDDEVESVTPTSEDSWICVPGESGVSFYFNTLTMQQWTGDGIPPNVVSTPTLDSPIIPPRSR